MIYIEESTAEVSTAFTQLQMWSQTTLAPSDGTQTDDLGGDGHKSICESDYRHIQM